jgi:two-component system, NtrC family, nitrogen regulation sensor histidine kinase NtrY
MFMQSRTRLIGLATTLIVALTLFVVGTWLETRIFDGLTSMVRNQSFLSVLLFFGIVNLNAVLAFVMIFLSFRNAVKMVVERQRAVFGSSLRTRLVTLFLFFSLVPTLILLYISTKFVNVRFESWMPPSVAETATQSFHSEAAYRDKLIGFLNQSSQFSKKMDSFDFVVPVNPESKSATFFRSQYQTIYEDLLRELEVRASQIKPAATTFRVNDQHYAVVALRGDHWVGYISPPSILNQWELLTRELIEAQPGVELVRLSYYVLLGALTVLLVFSALWLGVTIARELTGPIQALAHATELVAQLRGTTMLISMMWFPMMKLVNWQEAFAPWLTISEWHKTACEQRHVNLKKKRHCSLRKPTTMLPCCARCKLRFWQSAPLTC